jgi:2-iminobutanoate/2-iminopropanoate deaminase
MAGRPEEIRAPGAPAPVGPYSQGVAVGELVFTSGQIPLDPATGKPVTGGIAAETERVIDNLAAVLEAAGSSLSRVVKTTVFLTDLALFAEMNKVYSRRFTGAPLPARSTVEVPALALGVSIEIEAIALRDPR